MRKTTFALGLGLALSLGAAELTAQAPAPQQDGRPRAGADRGDRARGPRAQQPRGDRGDTFLLRGITLTDAQQEQVKKLREDQRASMQANAEARRKSMEEGRAARQRGDTAAVRQLRETQRAQMAQQMERQTAALRAILTPEQQAQFDKNVAEAKERSERRPAGGRDGRGARQGA